MKLDLWERIISKAGCQWEVGSGKLAVGSRQLAVGSWQLVVGSRQLAVRRKLADFALKGSASLIPIFFQQADERNINFVGQYFK